MYLSIVSFEFLARGSVPGYGRRKVRDDKMITIDMTIARTTTTEDDDSRKVSLEVNGKLEAGIYGSNILGSLVKVVMSWC